MYHDDISIDSGRLLCSYTNPIFFRFGEKSRHAAMRHPSWLLSAASSSSADWRWVDTETRVRATGAWSVLIPRELTALLPPSAQRVLLWSLMKTNRPLAFRHRTTQIHSALVKLKDKIMFTLYINFIPPAGSTVWYKDCIMYILKYKKNTSKIQEHTIKLKLLGMWGYKRNKQTRVHHS